MCVFVYIYIYYIYEYELQTTYYLACTSSSDVIFSWLRTPRQRDCPCSHRHRRFESRHGRTQSVLATWYRIHLVSLSWKPIFRIWPWPLGRLSESLAAQPVAMACSRQCHCLTDWYGLFQSDSPRVTRCLASVSAALLPKSFSNSDASGGTNVGKAW